MNSMKAISIVYTLIIALGILTLTTGVHYFANIAGFIAAIGFLFVFFKDPDKDASEEQAAINQKFKRYWYIVFGTGLFFSMLFGSFWNDHMGNMI